MTLGITLRDVGEDWVRDFAAGLFEVADEYGVHRYHKARRTKSALFGIVGDKGLWHSIALQAFHRVAIVDQLLRREAVEGARIVEQSDDDPVSTFLLVLYVEVHLPGATAPGERPYQEQARERGEAPGQGSHHVSVSHRLGLPFCSGACC